MNSKCCYIITHRDITQIKDRTSNLFCVINHVKNVLNHKDILILEQSEHQDSELVDKLSSMNVNYVHLKNVGLFNRGWAFNCAAKISKKEFIIFADNDMILHKDQFNVAVNELVKGFSVVRPYNGYSNDMTFEQTEKFKKTGIIGNGVIRPIPCLSGGIIMFNREMFLNIGGFDERFEGWGGEDDEMHNHLSILNSKKVISCTSISGCVQHLYHGRTIYDCYQQPNYNNNLICIKDGKRNFGIKEIGNLKKYCGEQV